MTTPRRLRRPQAKRFNTYAQRLDAFLRNEVNKANAQRLDAFLRAGHRTATQVRAFEAAWKR